MFTQEHMKNVSLDLDAKAPKEIDETAEGTGLAKDIFCSNWHIAKKVLIAQKAIAKNGFVRMIVQGVIWLGDHIAEKNCGTADTEEKTE